MDRDNPWPGLASFTESSRAFFFGREQETEELVRLIRRNTLTVLFGQSGLGKSSLLQAGAFPVLREADFLPLYLRLDHSVSIRDPQSDSGRSLADQVKSALVEAFHSVGADAPAPRADETLWEYFHRKDVDIWSAKNRLLTPVLAFDQFEEIFTLGRAGETQRERGRAFLTELADLVENRPPAELRARFDQGELDTARYNFDKPSCQVVLSLREDFLPDLEGLKHEMRSILHSRMRVKRLDGTQALEIVQRPAPHLIAEGVAERIVEFVAGARGGSAERLAELEVEPALLSVICRELNERRRALGQAQITADLVSGNRREILTDFYERSVADVPADMRAFVEDHLLTKSGFRDNLALETALEFPGVTLPLIDTLVSRRLLRIEDRLGVQRVELTHDVLAEVIRASRDARKQRQATEQLRQRERITRRRMWLARIIAAGLLVAVTGVSWVAWRAIRAERDQARLRADADTARVREAALRAEAEAQELTAKRIAYASDMNSVQAALAIDNLRRARELLNRHRPQPGEADLRGWEWRYLWQFCRSDASTVLRAPNNDSIYSLSASADGAWLAAGTRNGGLSVFHLPTKEEIKLPAGAFNVRVSFSPRRPRLAVAYRPERGGNSSAQDRVMMWDLASRQKIWDIELSSFAGLHFSDDGEILLAGVRNPDSSGAISLRRASDGTVVSTWIVEGRLGSGTAGATATSSNPFSITRDASTAAIGSGSALRVIDLGTGLVRWKTEDTTSDAIRSVAFAPDGRLLAVGMGYADMTIGIWDASTGRALGRLQGQRGWTSEMKFLDDGRHLVSASGDQTLRLWDIERRALVRSFRGHDSEVYACTLFPDRKTFASGGKDGAILLWDLHAERATTATGAMGENVADWTFGADGESIVAMLRDGRLVEWAGPRFDQEKLLLSLDPISFNTLTGTGVIFSRKLPLVAARTESGKIQVWDWRQRTLLREWSEATSKFPCGIIADGSRLLVTGINGESRFVAVREIASGRELLNIEFPASLLPGGLIVTPTLNEKRVLMVTNAGGHAVEIDLESGRSNPTKLDIVETSYASSVSPDGRRIALASFFGYARIFDASSLQPVATLQGFMFGVHGPAFMPDGSRLAVGGTASEALTIWEPNTYERLLTVEAFSGGVRPVRISPAGNVITGRTTTGGGAGTLLFWRAPSWAEIEKAEAAVAKP